MDDSGRVLMKPTGLRATRSSSVEVYSGVESPVMESEMRVLKPASTPLKDAFAPKMRSARFFGASAFIGLAAAARISVSLSMAVWRSSLRALISPSSFRASSVLPAATASACLASRSESMAKICLEFMVCSLSLRGIGETCDSAGQDDDPLVRLLGGVLHFV